METLPHSDPPQREELVSSRKWVREFLRMEVQPKLESSAGFFSDRTPLFVGTGGTATILARIEAQMRDFDRAQIEKTRLSIDRLQWHVAHLWSLPLEQRRNVIGLPANRADVILMGSVIFEMVMESFGLAELRISTRDLRFAAVMGA